MGWICLMGFSLGEAGCNSDGMRGWVKGCSTRYVFGDIRKCGGFVYDGKGMT
jgi:hypothetical protein